MRYSLYLFVLFLWAGLAPSIQAQDEAELFDEAILLFRAEQFAEAADQFNRVLSANPEQAEAHYMLARIYHETRLKDGGKASHHIEKALELEPQNIQYMVGRLEQMRDDTSNFLLERIRDEKRKGLAKEILVLDSTNAFAHEELGITYIHDFWRYRNAISLPTLGLRETLANRERSGNDFEEVVANADAQDTAGDITAGDPFIDQDPGDLVVLDQMEFRIDDQFNIDRLRSQGVPVQDMSRRANRAYARAVGHLKRAIQNDPMRRTVYTHLMQIYALREAHRDAAEMLQKMYIFFPDDVELWTYLGYNHYHLGNMEAAAKSFEVAFKKMSPEDRYAFENLDLLLPEDEKKQYEENRVMYASRFWTSKDPRFLTTYNERKLEHYTRLVYADLLYGAPKLKSRGWNTQRGQILVRYGIPQSDVVITGGFDAILRQIATSRSRTSETTQPELGEQTPGASVEAFDREVLFNNTFNIWDYGDFRFVFEDPFRNSEYRLYTPPASMLNEGVNAWANDYVIKARETFRETPERYEYRAPGRQVDIPYLVNAFKGPDNHTDVYVHYGIPVQNYEPGKDLVDLNLRTGAFLINEQRDILVERRRKLYGLKTAQIKSFEGTNLWVDTQPMKAPPGDHQISVEFETNDGGTVAVQRRDVTIPGFDNATLALSDMLLAYVVEESEDGKPINSGDIVRHGLSITPAPWTVYDTTQPIYLYFELYNLTKDQSSRTRYEVQAVLAPKDDSSGISKLFKNIFGGSDKGVGTSYESGGLDSDEEEYLIMDASSQEPGVYTLVLRVRDLISDKTVDVQKDLYLQ